MPVDAPPLSLPFLPFYHLFAVITPIFAVYYSHFLSLSPTFCRHRPHFCRPSWLSPRAVTPRYATKFCVTSIVSFLTMIWLWYLFTIVCFVWLLGCCRPAHFEVHNIVNRESRYEDRPRPIYIKSHTAQACIIGLISVLSYQIMPSIQNNGKRIN